MEKKSRKPFFVPLHDGARKSQWKESQERKKSQDEEKNQDEEKKGRITNTTNTNKKQHTSIHSWILHTFLRSRFKVLFLQVTRVISPNKESERNPLLERNLLKLRMRKRRSKVNESRIFKYSGKLVCGRFQSIRNSKFVFQVSG